MFGEPIEISYDELKEMVKHGVTKFEKRDCIEIQGIDNLNDEDHNIFYYDEEGYRWGVGEVSYLIENNLFTGNEDMLYISNLRIDSEDQRKGIGRKIVTDLYNQFKLPITGEASDTGIIFWRKIGAKYTHYEELNTIPIEDLDKYYTENFDEGTTPIFILENIK